MRRLGRRSGAAVVLLLGVLVAAPASPAGAEEGGPTITIDSPRAEPPLESSTVTVSGRATSATLYRMKDVTFSIGSETQTKTCTESPCSFSWTVSRPANGRYELKLVATQALPLVGTAGPSTERSRTFFVAAPAAKPVLDAPKVNEARNTELSWSRNTEPDMLYYAVFRKDPGGSKYLPVGSAVPQPSSGAKVSFTDTTTSAFVGGDYSYQVVAVRKGAGGTWPAEIASEPSSVRTATVPAPPSTTATTAVVAPPGSPAAGPSPTTTAKPGTSAGVDLSGFLSTRSQPITLPAITVPEPPDTGFQGTLPFGARPAGDDVEEGDAEAVAPADAPKSIISRISPGRPLVPVAGGLVLLLLAMHMRVLNHRIKAAPATDLPVDDGPAPAPAPAAAHEAPAPAPVPAPALYDVNEEWAAEDPSSEDEWAPVAEPEPEPEPEPVTLWAPTEIDALEVVDDPQPDPEPEPVTLWAPTEIDALVVVDDPEPDPEPEPFDPDAIEVFEVVSSNRRRLARAGAR